MRISILAQQDTALLDFGQLFEHDKAVTALAFANDPATHLLSGDEAGVIQVYQTSDWTAQLELKGHSAAVNALSVHPSGRVALSVSKDRTLRLWDLIKGVLASTVRLRSVAYLVAWSPSGTLYALTSDSDRKSYHANSMLSVYDQQGKVSHRMRLETKIVCLRWLDGTRIALGTENGFVYVYDLGVGEEQTVLEWQAHALRVRGLDVVGGTLLATCSSDGEVAVWDLQGGEIKLAAAAKGGSRITCMQAVPHVREMDVDACLAKQKKRKAVDSLEGADGAQTKKRKSKKKKKKKKKKAA